MLTPRGGGRAALHVLIGWLLKELGLDQVLVLESVSARIGCCRGCKGSTAAASGIAWRSMIGGWENAGVGSERIARS